MISMPPQVFVSYNSRNMAMAREIVARLRQEGIDCWFSEEAIKTSENFAAAIPPAISGSGAFLLLLTEEAMSSPWVPRELIQAVEEKKRIFCLSKVPREALTDDFRMALRTVQIIDARKDPQAAQNKLTADLKAYLGKVLPSQAEEPAQTGNGQASSTPAPAPPQEPAGPWARFAAFWKKHWLLLSLSALVLAALLVLLLIIDPFRDRAAPTLDERNRLLADTNKYSKYSAYQSSSGRVDQELPAGGQFHVLDSQYLREEIASIIFLDSLQTMPTDAWDVSALGTRTVMAWVKARTADDLYDLYIGAEGGILAPENCDYLFTGYSELTGIQFNGCFHTEGTTSMRGMFAGCPKLRSLDLSGMDVSEVRDMSHMFEGDTAVLQINLTGWQTPALRNMTSTFYGCKSLTELDLSGFDTCNVWTMSSMFSECWNLTTLDVSGFDTSGVADMSSMFCGCEALTSLDLSGFDTSGVADMSVMFSGCEALTSLDLSGFDTRSVTNMRAMFCFCFTLTTLDISGFDTSSVTDMGGMFEFSGLTELDLSGFATSSVTNMNNMFHGCGRLKELLIGSGFVIGEDTDTSEMFYGCDLLGDHELVRRVNGG